MPGKTARKNNRAHWRQKRASEKAARRAEYQSKVNTDRNFKSKTSFNSKNNKNKMRARTHPYGRCGNLGCSKCFPQFAKGALGF